MENTAESLSHDDTSLLKTPLFALHKKRGGKMVPFAGYAMPVQYDGLGVMKEHLHTRENAGLFDVSHMGQAWLRCAEHDPADALEKIVPGDIKNLKPGRMRYTVLLNEEGGIIDDLMVTRIDDMTLFVVINAACKAKDLAYIADKTMDDGVDITVLEDRALLALQGPKAEAVLSRFVPGAADMKFMTLAEAKFDGIDVIVSRSGYTGEDGFEISAAAEDAVTVAEKLLDCDEVMPIGLGARDSLRLEAGLCLYGHDLDEDTTPVEANLKWVISKRRREEGGFAGADKILKQFSEGTDRLRVGIAPQGRAPVREGAELVDENDTVVGEVTSGGFGPSVEAPVAMGYVKTELAATGTKLFALLRGRKIECAVADLPFVQPNYKRG